MRSRVSNPASYTNEIEYLNMENRTLRNRLDKMHSTTELARNSRLQLSSSANNFNVQPSINRNLINNSMHPTIILTH
jgi:regulator of replication initiation timing